VSWALIRPPAGHLIAQGLGLGVSRGILVVVTVLVARDVGLPQYGSFAAAFVAFSAGILLRDAGLGQGLIVLGGREPGLSRPAFVLTILVGMLLGLGLAWLSGPVSDVLGMAAAAPLVRILAVAFAIGSLGVASNATLERSLRFTTRALVDVLAYVGLGATTLALLAMGLGVASLAWGYVVHAAIQSATAIVLAPPWHHEHVGRGGIRRLAGYSGLLWASALLSYLGSNGDNVLIARLGGAEALGVYALSYALGSTLPLSIAQVVNRVALPYYAAGKAPGRTLRFMAPLALALAGIPGAGLIFGAPEIGAIALGPGVGVAPLILLTVYGLVRALGMSIGTALNGTGRAGETLRGSGISVAGLFLLIPPAFAAAGLSGAASAVLASMVAGTAYLAYRASRIWPRILPPPAAWFAGATGLVGLSMLIQEIPLPVRVILGTCLAVALIAWALRSFGSLSVPSLLAVEE
jgi:PST family polysaccharide transporter